MTKKIVYLVLAIGAIAFWCYMHSDRAKIARVLGSREKREFSADLVKNDKGEWRFASISLPEMPKEQGE